MKSLLSIIWLTPILGVLGCSHLDPGGIRYVAEVKKLDTPKVANYSPTRGQPPLTVVYAEVNDADGRHHAAAIQIRFLKPYIPSAFGEEGDTIAFTYRGRLPLSGELWFEQLMEYNIIGKKGSREAPGHAIVPATPRSAADNGPSPGPAGTQVFQSRGSGH